MATASRPPETDIARVRRYCQRRVPPHTRDKSGSRAGGKSRWPPVIATVPMLISFFVGQRSFVEGIATTGRKG
jgi:hypothetical protein